MNGLAGVARVRSGVQTAQGWLSNTIACAQRAESLNCFTTLREEQAVAVAATVDRDPSCWPLAGLPFAAKDLFDVVGLPTLAGSRINRDAEPATCDATVIRRLAAAGANLVGLTNMDEFAYGFSTENAHYGPTRNPHDPDRIAGGSSGGSAAAVAAGIVPVGLGSDTNGSIRVPASLCGIYGLKPTYGRLSRAGAYPFVADLDHVGPFARDLADLAAVYDTLQGSDSRDPTCGHQPDESVLPSPERESSGIRVGVLQGWFHQGATEQALAAVDCVVSGFRNVVDVTLEGAEAARSAAFCLTAMQGGSFHAERLRTRPMDFDPAVRDRLLAGLLLPAEVAFQVRRVRRRFLEEALELFRHVDVLLAPATPCAAPMIGQTVMEIAGREVPVRANLGIYTQPISFIGLPVLAVPVCLPGLPIGVQIIGAPWQEATIFRAAAAVARLGRIGAHAVPRVGLPEA